MTVSVAQFKRLGVRGDWENPYITLKPAFEARQIEVFGEMAKKGYIYKGLKPVYWSPSSESALAEAEIEYQDKKSPSIYVSFPVKDGKGVIDEDVKLSSGRRLLGRFLQTLGFQSIRNSNMSLLKLEKRNSLSLKIYLRFVAEELGWEDYAVERELKGSELDRIVAKHPLYDRDSLVMLGEHVTAEAGTGCVHTAPGHGEDDFYVSKSYGIDALISNR